MNIEEKLDKLVHDVERIKGYLESDSKTNTKGIVETVRDNSIKIHQLKQNEQIRKTKIAAYSVVAGGLFWGAVFIIKEVFKQYLSTS